VTGAEVRREGKRDGRRDGRIRWGRIARHGEDFRLYVNIL